VKVSQLRDVLDATVPLCGDTRSTSQALIGFSEFLSSQDAKAAAKTVDSFSKMLAKALSEKSS
jgi:hypothetical protein